jgi:hypothetical protein
MGVEVETEGIGEAWYEQGQFENTVLIDAYTTEGLFFEGVGGSSVTFVTPLELTVLLGFGIDWNIQAKHIELHGTSHWSTAFSDGWYQQNTDFSATSIGSHTQTVKGSTSWTSDGAFTLTTPAPQAAISISTANNGRIFLGAGAGSLALAATATTLAGSGTSVTGTTKVQLTGGGNSVLLNATQASLMCGNAGITAMATSTVISGAKVEIGLPNGPVPVATATQVAAVNTDVTDFQAEVISAVSKLRERLAELQRKFSKSLLGKLS